MKPGIAAPPQRFALAPDDPREAPLLQRSVLGAEAAAVMALVVSLAAVLELIEPEIAAEACIVLAVLVAIFYAAQRWGFSLRWSEPGLAASHLAGAFLWLAYLTFRVEDTPAAISVLYCVAMLYGVLRLDTPRLVALAAFGLVAHGTALFMLIDHGHRIDRAAAWTQFGALTLTLLWFAFAARGINRLRAHLSEANRKLQDLSEEARDRASRDALTGAYHRRHLMEALEREASRADRTGKPLSIARIDLDRFRSLNESFGYATGDAVLKRFADAAHRVIRDVDVFGRYGGREFLLIMPDADLAGAVIGAERHRAALEREEFPELGGKRRVTCTCGVARYRKGEDLARVLGRAEEGLTYGKVAGRNRVIALGEDDVPPGMEHPPA